MNDSEKRLLGVLKSWKGFQNWLFECEPKHFLLEKASAQTGRS